MTLQSLTFSPGEEHNQGLTPLLCSGISVFGKTLTLFYAWGMPIDGKFYNNGELEYDRDIPGKLTTSQSVLYLLTVMR